MVSWTCSFFYVISINIFGVTGEDFSYCSRYEFFYVITMSRTHMLFNGTSIRKVIGSNLQNGLLRCGTRP